MKTTNLMPTPMMSSTKLSAHYLGSFHDPKLYISIESKKFMRYVKGTVDHGLLFSKSTDFRLLTFSDADWGGDLNDRKSSTGFCVYLGCNMISWKSNKQTRVSRSSTEAEYRAMCAAQTVLMSIQQLLGELQIPQTMSPTIFCDNQSACLLAANSLLHNRYKHLELDLHFLRDLVNKKFLYVVNIPSQDQVANSLTKPLSLSSF
ncbi:hypothetical protein AAHE18_13G259400 [Arachis hypogaea]